MLYNHLGKLPLVSTREKPSELLLSIMMPTYNVTPANYAFIGFYKAGSSPFNKDDLLVQPMERIPTLLTVSAIGLKIEKRVSEPFGFSSLFSGQDTEETLYTWKTTTTTLNATRLNINVTGGANISGV